MNAITFHFTRIDSACGSLSFVIAVILALVTTHSASAQALVRGLVVEDGTELPIVLVEVRMLDTSGAAIARSLTNEDGRFRMELPDSGVYSIAVERVGYASLSADSIPIADGDEIEIEIRLDPRAVVLDAISVVVRDRLVPSRITEYRERASFNRRAGIGRIYMREDLERLRPNSAQEILDRVPWRAQCRPLILLDGLPFDGPMTMIDGEQVEGIEIYRGMTQIPIEFYRNNMCGIALVWTRSDPPGMKPFTWMRLLAAGAIVALIGFLTQ